MKRIDTTEMILVHYGREWQHEAPPCSRCMVSKLERNERLVFWLQPKNGTEQDQVPALKLPDGFYSLSLRMMKAIWRHVRLRKGFHNLERAQLGGYKLRIPRTLLTEKIRTQSRFNTMRMSTQAARPPQKNLMSAASKISKVVNDFFLPLADGYFPSYTPLTSTPDDEENLILERIWDTFPEDMRSREAFVARMGDMYDSSVQGKVAGKRKLDSA